MKLTLLSSKGQITIPKAMQRQLQIGSRSRVALFTQNDTLVIKPLKTSIIEQTAGSLARYIPLEKRQVPLSTVRTEVKKQVASRLAIEGGTS